MAKYSGSLFDLSSNKSKVYSFDIQVLIVIIFDILIYTDLYLALFLEGRNVTLSFCVIACLTGI